MALYRTVLPSSFKSNMNLDHLVFKEVPEEGLPSLMTVMDDFEEIEFQKLLFSQPVLVKQPHNMGIRVPKQSFRDPHFIETCHSQNNTVFEQLTMPNSDYKRYDEGEINNKALIRAMTGNPKDVKPFAVLSISTPAIYRRHFKVPCICDQHLGHCLSGSTPLQRDTFSPEVRTCVMREGMFLNFHTSKAGSFRWILQNEGSQVVFFVDGTDEDLDVLNNFKRRTDGKFAPEEFKNRIQAFQLREGQLYMFPGTWPHAFLSMTSNITYFGDILVTAGIPGHIRFHESEMEDFPGNPKNLYHNFEQIIDSSLPMVLEDFYRMSYMFNSRVSDLLRKVLGVLEGRPHFRKNASMFALLQDITSIQEEKFKSSEILQHVTGASFSAPMRYVFSSRYLFLKGTLLSNVLIGTNCRDTLTSSVGQIDYYDGHSDVDIEHHFGYFQWRELLHSGLIKTHLGEPGFMKAFAGKHLNRLDIVGEIRGELLQEEMIKVRYGSPTPPLAELYFLRNLYEMRDGNLEFLTSVYIDSTVKGGVNKYFSHGSEYNCEPHVVIVENAYKLAIQVVKNVQEGEPLVLPCFMNMDTVQDLVEPLNVQEPTKTKERTDDSVHIPKGGSSRAAYSTPTGYRATRCLEVHASEYTMKLNKFDMLCLTPRQAVVDIPGDKKYKDIVLNSPRNMKYFIKSADDGKMQVHAVKDALSLPAPPPNLAALPSSKPIPKTEAGPKGRLIPLMEDMSDFDRRRQGYRQFSTDEEYRAWNDEEKRKVGKSGLKHICMDEKCQKKDYGNCNKFPKHVTRFHTPYPFFCPFPECSHGACTLAEIRRHYPRHKTWDPAKWLELHGTGEIDWNIVLTPFITLPEVIPPTVSRRPAYQNQSTAVTVNRLSSSPKSGILPQNRSSSSSNSIFGSSPGSAAGTSPTQPANSNNNPGPSRPGTSRPSNLSTLGSVQVGGPQPGGSVDRRLTRQRAVRRLDFEAEPTDARAARMERIPESGGGERASNSFPGRRITRQTARASLAVGNDPVPVEAASPATSTSSPETPEAVGEKRALKSSKKKTKK